MHKLALQLGNLLARKMRQGLGLDQFVLDKAGLGLEKIMSYSIRDLSGIEAGVATKLKAVGIRTTEKLLDAAKNLKGRKALTEKTGVHEKDLLRIANKIDRMRVKGVGQDYAELLQAAGVDTVRELQYRNSAKLAAAMAAANAKRKLVRVLPSEQTVRRWVENARNLPLQISY